MFINANALAWAFARLSDWKSDRGPRGLQNLFRFFLLKRLGVPVGEPVNAPLLNSNQFRNVCRQFLQVSFQDDETASRTGQLPYYLNPYTFQFYKAVGSSDYAVGTMWTRCGTWKSNGVIDFTEDESHQRRIAFEQDYIELIRDPLLRNGEAGETFARIPGLPLAIFLFRRPSDCTVSTATVQTATDLVQLFRSQFNISDDEAAALLDLAPGNLPADSFGDHEITRTSALDVVANFAPLPGGEPAAAVAAQPVPEVEPETVPAVEAPAGGIGVDWATAEAEDEAPCGLLGLQATMRKAISALRSGKQIILIGPPGTGKTELAHCICLKLGVNFDLVTATSDWTTFDTIGGYMPDPSLRQAGSPDPLNFFPAIVSQSLLRRRWLIIDEINRADIDKAFGEMFTLLAGKSVRLPYKRRQGDSFLDVVLGAAPPGEEVFAIPVPQNWRLIGTMNTFDKSSLFQLSFAFMRRFAFIEVPIPAPAQFSAILNSRSAALRQSDFDPVYDRCMELPRSIFAPSSGQGLSSLGLAVGPAIALDAIRFLAEHRRISPAASAPDLILAAIEMYLYPQFEGQDAKHVGILRVIRETLELDPSAASNTDARLAVWTGFEASRGL